MASTAVMHALDSYAVSDPTDRFVLIALADGGTGDDDFLLISSIEFVTRLARISQSEAIERIASLRERGIAEYDDDDLQKNVRGERSGFLCRLNIEED